MARPALELLTRTGMQNISNQIECLTRLFLMGVEDLGIETKTPASSVGPLVVLRAPGDAAPAMLRELTARGIVASIRQDGVRFSFHAYNMFADVEIALRALKDNLGLMARA
jgi:selenocysteine lyase/cysteine desulfurase